MPFAYDTADRPTTGGNGSGTYTYDAFGRQTTLPAADAPDAAKGTITLGYFDDDLARTITQGSLTTTLQLDTSGRRTVATTTDSAAGTTTSLERHYADSSDNPAWTVKTDALGNKSTTRHVESIGGDLGATINADGPADLTLATLHGDIVTTVEVAATQTSDTPSEGITGWSDYTEYGTPKDPAATGAVAGTIGYGWLGAKQRSTTSETAGLALMGVRLYNAATGRFTSTDPIPGGSSYRYGYPYDPVNMRDLDGRHWGSALRYAGRYLWRGAKWAGRQAWSGIRWAGRQIARGFKWANRRGQQRYARYLADKYNGGRNRATIEGRGYRTHYDLKSSRRDQHYNKGKGGGYVDVPHKTYQFHNYRAPHGWGKESRAYKAGWRDLFRVHRHFRSQR